MTRPDPEELRRIDLLEALDDAQLAAWADAADVREVAAGEVLAEQGVAPPGFQLLLEGSVRATMHEGDRVEPVGMHVAPTWMGAIPLLTDRPVGVRMTAETPCRVALVPPEDFERIVLGQPVVHRQIMKRFAPVMGRIEAVSQNRERLEALGTMAAGLAHEMNNPAAAAKRAAAEMADALTIMANVVKAFVAHGVEREQAEGIVALQQQALQAAESRTALDALDAADAEDELLERLEDLGIDEPWRLAEPLAAAGVDQAWLDEMAALSGTALPKALKWVAASLTARTLADELRESTMRMSQLVKAVKAYAYMDRGELVEADVHEGLETTLVVMGHKLKHTQIEVRRDYDRTLPPLTVHGSELNQVWTNLVDNAVDALGETGTLEVATRRDGPGVRVEVTDDGPGVPPELVDRIMDPFFTTKGVGAGTGLGLDTARRIVEDRHRGRLSVTSRPGRTTFAVWLPLGEA